MVVNKRKYGSYARTAMQAARAAGGAYRIYSQYRRKINHGKRVAHKTRKGGSRVVTQQHDISTKRRKTLSGKQKRWLKFKNKVEKAVHENNTMLTFVESSSTTWFCQRVGGNNRQMPFVSSRLTSSTDMRIGCYGASVNAGILRFITEIRDQTHTVTNLPVPASLNTPTVSTAAVYQDIFVKGCSLTVSLKNVTGEDNGAYDGSSPDVIFVDIYEVVARADTYNVGQLTAYEAWLNLMANSQAPAGVKVGASWSIATPTVSGVTPYCAPDFGKFWKILKKTRVTIAPGQKVNYTAIGYKGMTNFAEEIVADQNTKGKVKDLICVVNPTFNDDASNPADKQYCEIQWSKYYSLSIKNHPTLVQPITATYAY